MKPITLQLLTITHDMYARVPGLRDAALTSTQAVAVYILLLSRPGWLEAFDSWLRLQPTKHVPAKAIESYMVRMGMIKLPPPKLPGARYLREEKRRILFDRGWRPWWPPVGYGAASGEERWFSPRMIENHDLAIVLQDSGLTISEPPNLPASVANGTRPHTRRTTFTELYLNGRRANSMQERLLIGDSSTLNGAWRSSQREVAAAAQEEVSP